ncbi:hypothetical protein N7510_003007 [Penicillium lagena]|uniref:uncharacterized protein n=1 Tax=Penicillium lagena TaxID=94218 RepID=UPI0025426359|nr:uncharacterized protein N7510_003007 [Penicillium lagena]KAJ5619023.1 hypothetical protein N7510_003007 [Penicillium lagena]
MLAAGRSWNLLLHRASILLALVGTVIGDVQQPLGTNITTPLPSETRTTPPPTCPAKNVWAVERELFELPICLETRWGRGQELLRLSGESNAAAADNSTSVADSTATASSSSGTAENTTVPTSEEDTDSLLDSASFLSFEDWKKQNLAKAGQSAENVGGGRRSAAAGKEGRRQPAGINNALDSLGDDTEIELEFGGFGAETPEAAHPTTWMPARGEAGQDGADGEAEVDRHVQQGGGGSRGPGADVARRKDAGTTCKERFNYASFDCAATVLKTNPECKGPPSVLIENKDSYMLNECRAQNKFLILELCDDILVDTVVLANYEFFSSIFHTFRVSVSDRYPAKPDQWKELGVYEARNTREVQAFAVENALIWARYLRIEFLTHYGHEFYCPVSLIRVHGTTMMEEYKHDEGAGHVDVEMIDEPVETDQQPGDSETDRQEMPAHVPDEETLVGQVCPKPLSEVELLLFGQEPLCAPTDRPPTEKPEGQATVEQIQPPSDANSTTSTGDSTAETPPGSSVPPNAAVDTRKTGEVGQVLSAPSNSSTVVSEATAQNATESTGKTTAHSKNETNTSPESVRSTNTQPPSANPTTQESFFKSVHKRLQMLESNSTLSLLYIEEQSRILRDAFNKVEKRQLSKTSTFLENLNVTVLSELKQFREQYDHVWKSVALEFEHQRLQYHREVHSLSAQLGVLADELVFQKRVTVIQSIMVLCCFALVLFSRSSVGNYMEFPSVQRIVERSHSLRSSSPFFGSPSASPGPTRPTSSYRNNATHNRNLSDSSSLQNDVDSSVDPAVAYIPPTPTSTSDSSQEMMEDVVPVEKMDLMDLATVPEIAPPQVRPRSTPPVLTGGHLAMTTGLDSDEEEGCGCRSRLSPRVSCHPRCKWFSMF